ncbi:hypothetical protein KI387_022448, partial [Taxus chinensis]
KVTEGIVYNISQYIADEIISSGEKGGKILFGNILLTIVFSEVGVPDASNKFVWEYLDEDPSPTERFQKYTCESMIG